MARAAGSALIEGGNEERLACTSSSWPVVWSASVMAGLVPAIHDLSVARKTWMPATSAGMTVNDPG
jgi:hypothetical protein